MIIKTVGVGEAGCIIVENFDRLYTGLTEIVLADINAMSLDRFSSGRKIEIRGRKLWKPPFHTADLKWSEESALDHADEIRGAVGTAHMVLVVSAMGGLTGSGAAPVVARLARKTGAFTLGVISLPFSFEGKSRKNNAQQGRVAMEKAADATLCIDYNWLRNVLSPKATMREAFSAADKLLYESIHGLVEIFTRNPDEFEKIKQFLGGHRRMTYVFGKGATLMEAAKSATNYPLAPENAFLRSTRLLFGIYPSSHTPETEIRQAEKTLRARLPEKGEILGVRSGIKALPEIKVFLAEPEH